MNEIELNRVSKTFKGNTQAVQEVSFSVQSGELLGLIGTSGSGKTTTLKMINRLIEPSAGTIYIKGKNILAQNPEILRRAVGYVIQHIGLFPHYTIRQNLETVPRLLGWNREKIEKRCTQLMKLIDLDSGKAFMNKKPHELSGGQKQRIGLARALAADPPIVLLDEPFGALDPITRVDIRTQFKDLQQQLKKTMVMVTHDIAEAFELCDRIALLDGGQLQQIGTPRDLLFHPTNSFTKSFLDPNRFMLEMLTVTIGQSVRHSKPTPDGTHNIESKTQQNTVLTFDPDTSFLKVFKELENHTEKGVTVALSDQMEEHDRGYYNGDQLLHGFYNAKQTLLS